MVNRDPKVMTELREQPVLAGASQKIPQVDQIVKALRYFNMLREDLLPT